jgi:starch synthase
VHLPVRYTPETVSEGKTACKAALQERVHLPQMPRVPLLGMVTRLAEQKGIDLLAGVAGSLLHEDVQLVVLGTGDAGYHEMLKRLMARYPQKVAAMLTFDESLAHLIEAGADMFLMPSRYEPCGLNQMYSLAYGTVPLVRATGGLDDTIEPFNPATGRGTGFKFTEATADAFLQTVRAAVALYRQPQAWRRLVQNGMACDFSWDRSAREYEALYQQIVARRSGKP